MTFSVFTELYDLLRIFNPEYLCVPAAPLVFHISLLKGQMGSFVWCPTFWICLMASSWYFFFFTYFSIFSIFCKLKLDLKS